MPPNIPPAGGGEMAGIPPGVGVAGTYPTATRDMYLNTLPPTGASSTSESSGTGRPEQYVGSREYYQPRER